MFPPIGFMLAAAFILGVALNASGLLMPVAVLCAGIVVIGWLPSRPGPGPRQSVVWQAACVRSAARAAGGMRDKERELRPRAASQPTLPRGRGAHCSGGKEPSPRQASRASR
jgi:hypothetical protein